MAHCLACPHSLDTQLKLLAYSSPVYTSIEQLTPSASFCRETQKRVKPGFAVDLVIVQCAVITCTGTVILQLTCKCARYSKEHLSIQKLPNGFCACLVLQGSSHSGKQGMNDHCSKSVQLAPYLQNAHAWCLIVDVPAAAEDCHEVNWMAEASLKLTSRS